MRLARASLLTALFIPAALLSGGSAYGQQASFAVASTLHAASKPIALAQLCPEGKPMDIVGATVRVSCPVVAEAGTGTTERIAPAAAKGQRLPEVTVTF